MAYIPGTNVFVWDIGYRNKSSDVLKYRNFDISKYGTSIYRNIELGYISEESVVLFVCLQVFTVGDGLVALRLQELDFFSADFLRAGE